MKLWNILAVILVVLSSVYFVNIFQIQENISSFELNNVNVDSQVKIDLDEANKQLTVNYNSKKIKTIKFNNVNLNTINDSKLQINNDLLLNKTEETFKEEVNFGASENIVDAFSIDPSNVDFDDGSMEVVASGKKLWKCKDWNFTTQTCFGEWKLVKLLQPGEVYDIELYQGDPGFIETDFDKRIKAMLVYRESGSTDIRYRYLNNSYGITSELTAFTVGGFPRWMELQANPLYDEYLYGTHTADQDIEIAIFNGTDWINQLVVTTNSMPETRRAFDVAYEGYSGEGLVVYSEDNSNNIKYRTWDGTIFSSEQQFNMGASDNFVWTKLISRPENDEILFLGIWEDSLGDEYIVASIWNGATFTNTITLLSNENLQEEEVLDGTYVNDEWLVVHADGGSNSPVYRTFDGSWSSQATVANFGAQPLWIELETSSDGDDALLCAQDSSRDLNCMYWNGNSWQDQDKIDTDLEEDTFKNFDLAPFTNSNDFMITFGERSQNQYDYEIYDPDLGSYTRFAMDTGTTDNDWMMLERDPCEDYFLAFTLDDGADYELQLYNNSWTKYSQIDPNGFNQYRNADIIFSPICTIPLGDAGTNVFNETNSDFFSFNTGVFNNTVLYTSIPALTLDSSSSGTYTSQVFNANDTVSWQNISIEVNSSIDNPLTVLTRMRSCDDLLCSGENFVTLGTDLFYNLTVLNNNYIQYEFQINGSENAEITNVSIGYKAVEPNEVEVSLISPFNNSIDGNGLINFTYTAINSQNLDYCLFVLDNIIEFNETSPILGVNSYLQDQISTGAHTWYVNCTNANGFTNASEVYSFEIDSPVTPTLIQINESVEDAGNNLVTGAIELFDFYSGELDYSTNSGSPQSISTGTYNIKFTPSSVFEEIMFYGVNITADIDEIIDIDESNSDPKWSREFSFYTKIPFDYQNVTLTYNANSKDTFRCLNWDFDNSLCIGDNWIKEMDTIPGENFSFSFEANELKGYAEYGKDIVVLNKSNYLIDSDQTENPINGTNSDYDVAPQLGPFSSITVNSHSTIPSSDNEIVVSSFDDIYFEKSFGIDPEGIDAVSLNITYDNDVSGFYLFKCSNFTISIDECNNEDYIQEFIGLNAGDNWIVIDPTDPGFGITIQGPSNLNDSYFRQGAPNNNFRGSSNIRVGKSGSATNPIRGIIQFDISNLPSGVQVIDSNLSLYFFNIPFFDTGSSRTHGVHRIDTNKNWQELEITWNDINSTDSWTTAGGDFAASPTDTQSFGASDINSRIKWNVTADLNYYINNPTQNFGWVIRDQDESTTNTRRDYRSKDWSNVSQRPELEIFFIDIEPPQVTNLIPTNGSEFINGTIIEIGANVTDNINVSSVFANISYPNGTIITIPLSLQFASFYNASFTIPLDGLYNVSYFANDTDGLINDTQATQFSTILFPEITGSKSAQSNPVVEGTMFNYTITINNNGLGDAQNMTVLEIYPDNVSFVSANPAPTSGNDTWFFSSIAGGSSQIITIQVELENGTAGSSLLNKVNLSYFNQSNLVEIDFNNTVNVIQNVGAAAFGIHLSITPNHAEPDDLVLIELHSNYLNITSTNLTIYRIFDNVTYPIGSFEMTDLNPSIWFYELNASENVFGNYLAVVDAIVTGGQPYRDSKTFSILPRGIIDFVGRTPNTYEVNESVILGAEIRRNEETFNDGLENPRLLIYKDDILIQELNSSSGLILNDSLFLVNYTFNQTGSYLLEWFVDYYNRSKVTREIIGITKIDTEEKNENIVNLINQNMDKLDQVITTTEEIQEFSQEEIFLITDSINSVNKVGKEAEKDSIKSLENKLEELQKHNQVENSNLVTGSAISDILTVSTKSSSTSMLFVALVILIMLVFAKKPIQKGLSKIRFRKRESKVPSKLINTQPAKVSPQKKTTKTALIKKKMMSFTNWNGFRKTNSDISISKSKKVNKQFTPKVKTNRFSLVMDNALGIKKQKGFSSKQTQYLNNMFEDLKKYVQEKNRSASSNKDSFKLSTVRKKPNSKLAAKFSSNLKKYVESEIKINEGKSIRLSEVDQTFFRNDKGGSRENKIVAATENSAFRDDFFDFEENKSKRQIDSQESNASDNFFVSLNNVKDKVASAWKDDFADLTQSNNNLRVEDSISKKSFEGKHAKSGKGKDNNDSDKNKIDWSIMDGNLK